ncbi:DUF2845 domain-containing protein [Corallococcus exercitus]|uniref:DUF2845 domain-containing protein n=1 Tax=Corallococcus exercitus TaxID=2316736 RepID=A0A3A8IJD7_9BACT|nr:DUF2845 domain-containing protein [Corallococcus exercitus]NOK37297.1 DUF2845 domain-containing protein [Corallococcus exercitus]RKG78361.1 DUF2845 domain-containing protein [Corallococcus exercitus]
MRALPAALVVACLALPSLVHASALRCDNKLVSEGASQVDALAKCGEPVTKQSRTEYVTNKVKAKTPQEEASTEVTRSTTVEEWTYNFGPHRLMQVAIFRDGRLVDVRSGSYGY